MHVALLRGKTAAQRESTANLLMDVLRKAQICWAEISFAKAAAAAALLNSG